MIDKPYIACGKGYPLLVAGKRKVILPDSCRTYCVGEKAKEVAEWWAGQLGLEIKERK